MKWLEFDGKEMVRCGDLSRKELARIMEKRGREAFNYMKEYGYLHVLYGAHVYDSDGNLESVRFYNECFISDQEFDDFVSDAEKAGYLLYSFHNRCSH